MSTEVTTTTPTTAVEQRVSTSTSQPARRGVALTLEQAVEQHRRERADAARSKSVTKPSASEDIAAPDNYELGRVDAAAEIAIAQKYQAAEADAQRAVAIIRAAQEKTAREPDSGKRAALERQIAEASRSLQATAKQTLRELNEEAEALQKKRLDAERAKLPVDFDKKANKKYLQQHGYSDDEIRAMNARDALVVDKARRWDEQASEPRTLPKLPKPKQAQKEAPADQGLWRNSNPLHSIPGESPQDRLKRRGTIDDALAVLKQERAEKAKQRAAR